MSEMPFGNLYWFVSCHQPSTKRAFGAKVLIQIKNALFLLNSNTTPCQVQFRSEPFEHELTPFVLLLLNL